ncbi:hypothetical protein RA278_27750, partial [Pseudomonas syringae pv. tagetis]
FVFCFGGLLVCCCCYGVFCFFCGGGGLGVGFFGGFWVVFGFLCWGVLGVVLGVFLVVGVWVVEFGGGGVRGLWGRWGGVVLGLLVGVGGVLGVADVGMLVGLVVGCGLVGFLLFGVLVFGCVCFVLVFLVLWWLGGCFWLLGCGSVVWGCGGWGGCWWRLGWWFGGGGAC